MQNIFSFFLLRNVLSSVQQFRRWMIRTADERLNKMRFTLPNFMFCAIIIGFYFKNTLYLEGLRGLKRIFEKKSGKFKYFPEENSIGFYH